MFTNACLVTPGTSSCSAGTRRATSRSACTGRRARRTSASRVAPAPTTPSCAAFDLLLEGGVKVRLKAMALRSTAHELEEIGRFCRARTKDYYRFDPLLHLRFDGDPVRNEEIRAERLSPEEVVAVERADEERFGALQQGCADGELISPEFAHTGCDHLFHCGAGNGSFTVGPDGTFRLCSSLWHPDTVYDLRAGTLREAWEEWVPRVRDLRGTRPRVPREVPPLRDHQPLPLVPGARRPGDRRHGRLGGVLLRGRARAGGGAGRDACSGTVTVTLPGNSCTRYRRASRAGRSSA